MSSQFQYSQQRVEVCVTRECGLLWLGMDGIIVMLVCCVVNWDTLISVSKYKINKYILKSIIQGLLQL